MVQREDENRTGIEKLRFTMPDQPGMIYRFNRGRAPTAEDLISAYMSEIGRRGGLATKFLPACLRRRSAKTLIDSVTNCTPTGADAEGGRRENT